MTTNAQPRPPADAAEVRRVKGAFLLLSLVVLVLDQWSKWLVELHLPHLTGQRVIPGLLDFTHVKNTGVAFGLFASHGDLARTLALSAVGLLALAVVVVYFWRTPGQDRLLLAALALVLGGAVGNLVDRVMSGAVTDFVDVYVGTHHWHTFNVADSAITVGLLLMAWDALRPRPGHREAGVAAEG
ncbi:MAG TPA: signal peptidase II [Thermoanaerobaculia bacterium]|nr:signal peptidase II [Thermoanaerobaculia bacterium]